MRADIESSMGFVFQVIVWIVKSAIIQVIFVSTVITAILFWIIAVSRHALTSTSEVIWQENVRNVLKTAWYVVILQAAIYVLLAMSLWMELDAKIVDI